jgi:DNA methylase.
MQKNKEIWRPQLLPRTEEANSRYCNLDNDHRGDWKPSGLDVKTYSEKYDYEITVPSGRTVKPPKGACWRVSKERFQELVSDKRIWFGNDGNNVPAIKRFLSEVKQGITPLTIWLYEDVGHNQEATQELKKLGITEFDSPKPVRLIKRVIELSSCTTDDIILDFFAGSCTTAHAVLDLNKEDASTGSAQAGNRKFICVQLPEKCDENSEAYKAGYKTIAEIGKERIRRVIEHLTFNVEHGSKNKKEDMGQGTLNINHLTDKKKDKTEQASLFGSKDSMINDKCSMINENLGFKVFKLQESNFKIWRSKIETEAELVEQLQQHLEPLDEHAKTEDVLYELLLKSGVPLTARIEKKNGCLLVNDKEIALMLEKADDKIVKRVIAEKPRKVITLDRLFKNNDQLKTNTALQMKDAGIEFKAV